MGKKKIVLIFICVFIFLIIISIFNYKKQNSGNNINKSITDFKQYILNISSFEATISVEVISNKNTNKYIIKQYYKSPDFLKQEIQAPENIQGLTTLYDGSSIKIENSRLNLAKIYNDYNCLTDNILSLSSFIEDCKINEPICTETENEVILEIINKNKYGYHKKLSINKYSGLPTKMEIVNENKKTLVYILYNDITINSKTK